jgi:pSer/pThr/pTyr-binding forkhead associated (FHA) protein
MVYIRAWHVDRPDEVQEQELTAAQVTIGRGLDNDIRLDVPGASRRHALVATESGRVSVADCGSTNGTWIGGRRVERAPLAPGDRFQIGVMVFELAEASLTRPTVVEDWGRIQAPATARPPSAHPCRSSPPAARASVVVVDPATQRPLQPEKPIPVRGLAIGRDPSNDLCLEDGEVSRFHARVEPRGEQLLLQDLGSRNGTWVNRLRVREHLLADGDCFRVGTFTLLFRQTTRPVDPAPRRPARADRTPTPREGVPVTPPPTAAAPAVDPSPAPCPSCRAPMAPEDRFCRSCGGARDTGPS